MKGVENQGNNEGNNQEGKKRIKIKAMP